MRLIKCQLLNVRVHSDFSMKFSPRITLIGGSNETGKSTLIEALHRTLFLKASATGVPIESLQSRIHIGHPTIQLTFEANNQLYTLHKCFSGSSGQITLLNESSGDQLSGPIAEEYLAELLGVNETLSSRQAKTLLPTRWAHLWVMQGNAGVDLLNTNKENYDFDSLLIQLEKAGGAVIQQSPKDQSVVQLIDQAISENFTSRGIRKNSALWNRKEELDAAEKAYELACSKQLEYELATENLVKISEQVKELQSIELPRLHEQKYLLSKDTSEITRLKSEITHTEKELSPILLFGQSIKKDLNEISKLKEEVKLEELKRASLLKNQSKKKADILIINNEIKTKKEILKRLRLEMQKMDQQRELFQLLIDRLTNQQAISKIKLDIKKAQNISSKQNKLEKEISSLSKIKREHIQRLRNLQQYLRDILTRQKAMETSIKVISSDQSIFINGKEILIGDEKKLTNIIKLQIGNNITIELSPGGEDAIYNLKNQYIKTEEKILEILTKLGLESFEVAERKFELRYGLEQQLSALKTSPYQSIDIMLEDLNRHNQFKIDIESPLISFEQCKTEMRIKESILSNTTELGNLKNNAQKYLKNITLTGIQTERELEVTQEQLQKLCTSQQNEASKLKVIETKIISNQRQLSNLIKENISQESLTIQLNEINQQCQSYEKNLINLKDQLTSLSQSSNEDKLNDIESQIKSLENKKDQLIAQLGAAKGICETISSHDPYSEVEQAKVLMETIRTDFLTLKRVADAQKLLQKLFIDCQINFSTRYTEPLAKAIGDYLKPLIPEGPVAQMSFDQGNGFSGLRMRRGKEFYKFEQLSGGMKEQLAAALRLSMADVLKAEYDGCLPVVFDDAFTNSDPQRINLIKQIITQAVDNGLQVILLTCNPSSYGSFADQKVLLD